MQSIIFQHHDRMLVVEIAVTHTVTLSILSVYSWLGLVKMTFNVKCKIFSHLSASILTLNCWFVSVFLNLNSHSLQPLDHKSPPSSIVIYIFIWYTFTGEWTTVCRGWNKATIIQPQLYRTGCCQLLIYLSYQQQLIPCRSNWFISCPTWWWFPVITPRCLFTSWWCTGQVFRCQTLLLDRYFGRSAITDLKGNRIRGIYCIPRNRQPLDSSVVVKQIAI